MVQLKTGMTTKPFVLGQLWSYR